MNKPENFNRTQLLEDYINAGFALVPIPSESKGPINKGWNLRENVITSISSIPKVTANVGLAHAYSTPITYSIDIDDLNKARGWFKSKGVDLDALINADDAVGIESGKPNRAKLLYRATSGDVPLETIKITDKNQMILELRCASKNGKTMQDVLPPSIHPELKTPYRWVGQGSFKSLPILPRNILAIWKSLINSSGNAQTTNKTSFTDPNFLSGDEDTVLHALLSLEETPENIKMIQQKLLSISADCSYEDWVILIFAVKSLGWQSGKDIAKKWSMSAIHRWDEVEFNKLWESAKEDGGITYNTILGWDKRNAKSDNFSQTSTPEDEVHEALMDGALKIPVTPPPPRLYVFSDTVTFKTTALMGGLGGTAKTTFAMQLAVHGALHKPLGGMNVSEFSSLLMLGEENREEQDRRFGAICCQLTDVERQKVESRIISYPSAGIDIGLNRLEQGNLNETILVQDIINRAKLHEEECGIRLGLIIFDHARLVMSGDPIDANHVTQLTRILTKIANKTGAAVLLLAHSPKSVIGKDQSPDAAEIFGSTAFVDNARSVFILSTMRENEAKEFDIASSDRNDYVCLRVVKANYAPNNSVWWFKKEYQADWGVIILKPVNLYPTTLFSNHNRLSNQILNTIKSKPGQLTTRSMRNRSGKNGEFKASEAEVMRTLERLLEEGQLIKRRPTDAERKEHSLSQNIREVFDMPE